MSDESIALATPRPLISATIVAEALETEREQRKLLTQFIREQMVERTDYGTIPGTNRKGLLKPGAEKLIEIYRCEPTFVILDKTVDFDTGLFHYEFRCRLMMRESGAKLAEGFGSCNSREGKYRWRTASRKCPTCQHDVIRGKAEYGGGWLCWKKQGGCGAKFHDGDQTIEGQEVGKIENEDIATLANTILKMAKKRALVDAAIALARCSDIFTQDVEDIGVIEEKLPVVDIGMTSTISPETIERNKPNTLDDIKALLVTHCKTQTEKRGHLLAVFESAKWTEIESLDAATLCKGLQQMRENIEGTAMELPAWMEG